MSRLLPSLLLLIGVPRLAFTQSSSGTASASATPMQVLRAHPAFADSIRFPHLDKARPSALTELRLLALPSSGSKRASGCVLRYTPGRPPEAFLVSVDSIGRSRVTFVKDSASVANLWRESVEPSLDSIAADAERRRHHDLPRHYGGVIITELTTPNRYWPPYFVSKSMVESEARRSLDLLLGCQQLGDRGRSR